MSDHETNAAADHVELPRKMVPLSFEYRNAAGAQRVVVLHAWVEQGSYMTGRDASDGRYKTFRKDRVLRYLDCGESFMAAPWTPAPPRLSEARADGMQVLFTGFEAGERKSIEELASAAGLKVVKSVTKRLRFLVCGPTAGWRKVQQARIQGVHPVNAKRFIEFLDTGELPDLPEETIGERSFSTKLSDPAAHFAGWAFEIGQYHWSALGVSYRQFIEEQEVLNIKRQDGTSFTKSVPVFRWAVDTPVQYDFAQGDIFYNRLSPDQFIQVAADLGGGRLEVHQGLVGRPGSRTGFEAEAEQLAFWLEMGCQPKMIPVYRGNSKAGLLGWQLPE